MKFVVLTLMLGVFSATALSGKPAGRFEIHASYSQFPTVQFARFSDYTYTTSSNYCSVIYNSRPLKYIFEHNNASSVYQSGIYSIGADASVGKRYHICGDISLCRTYDNESSGWSIQILPSFKYLYKLGEVCRLYGRAGVGIGFYSGFRNCSKACFEYQLVPIGVELGRKLHGIAELGIGSVYVGMNIGIGYTF